VRTKATIDKEIAADNAYWIKMKNTHWRKEGDIPLSDARISSETKRVLSDISEQFQAQRLPTLPLNVLIRNFLGNMFPQMPPCPWFSVI